MPKILLSTVLTVLAAGLPAAGSAADDEAARKAAERDVKGIGWLFQQGLQAVPLPVALREQQPDKVRQQQIKNQAKQMERFFQPMLHAELELIRRSCGSLTPTARQEILEIGRKAVAAAAGDMAERQLTGRLGRESFEPREEIRELLAEAVARQATADESAAYQAAVDRRAGRRADAARVVIVARLDRQLDLSAVQRQAIEAELRTQWKPEWTSELEVRGLRVNNFPPAPERAAAAILPHLEPAQVTVWEEWCRAAGLRVMPSHFNLNFDGQGIQELDPWWGR
jgi:hypothetical protein